MDSSKLCAAFLLSVATICSLAGCAVTSHHYSSSVVQYLYPDQKERVEKPGIPLLSLPLRVGIAFVPETSGRLSCLTEKDKMDLMKEVSKHFEKCPFVQSIELVPSAYMSSKGGFANLDQVQALLGVDVIALISYDQAQFTDEGFASIAYWTLIGAYIVPGEKNDTHSMVDAAVYDIKSRKMLFRAPGTSRVKSRATPVGQTEQMRKDCLDGFKEASDDLINHLDEQLTLFKERVKDSPRDVQVVHEPGYTGGGSVDGLLVILSTIAGVLWLRAGRCKTL